MRKNYLFLQFDFFFGQDEFLRRAEGLMTKSLQLKGYQF